MSPNDLAAGAAFFALAVAAIPAPRIRRAGLGAAQAATTVTLLAVLAAAAVLQFRPDLAPPHVRAATDPWAALVARSAPAVAGYEWLVTATTAVLAGLPALAVLDFARRLAGYSAALDRLSGEVRAAARVMATRVPGLQPPAVPTITRAPAAAQPPAPLPVADPRPLHLADLLFPDTRPSR